jgi:hypothetical protein
MRHRTLGLALSAAVLAGGCNAVFGIHEGAPRPVCPDDMTIDDMEDGDTAICRRFAGRTGGWFAFGDGSPTGELTPSSNDFAPTRIEDGSRGTSRYAARLSGSGFTIFGAIMGLELLFPKQPFDASGLGGVTFWMRSNVPVAIDFPTEDTVPDTEGGQCQNGCNWHFSFEITAPAAGWFKYQVPFNALRGGGGGSASWNPRHLYGVNFRVPPGAPFDVWVDDVAFYACAGPECAPTCTDPRLPVSCRAMGGRRSSCAPPGTDCAVAATWCADPLMVDDMEDGDHVLCDPGGRVGTWSSGDSTTMNYDVRPTPIPGGRGTSRYAAHLTRVGSSGPQRMGFGVNAPGRDDYDASQFDGIRFWIKSDVPVTVGIITAEIRRVSEGGTCDLTADQTNCFYRFSFTMAATGGEWAQQQVPFSALKLALASFAPPTTPPATAIWNPSRLGAMAFLTSSADFAIWVDDLAFYTCGTEICGPTCTGDTPVSCAASGGRSAGCWPAGTDCESLPAPVP